MRQIKITLAYDGTDYHGWQMQAGLATIQGEVEGVLEAILKKHVIVEASGRTDAGVHALGQTASFPLDNRMPCHNLQRAMNHLLPKAIRILQVEDAAPRFHARFDAKTKLYQYRLYREDVCPPTLCRYSANYAYPLNEAAMVTAAAVFTGQHNFASFAAKDARYEKSDRTTIRRIFTSEIRRQGPELIYTVRGDGFLKHMVRNIVGTLIEAGKGNFDDAGIARLLEIPDRHAAGPTALPDGLCLLEVTY